MLTQVFAFGKASSIVASSGPHGVSIVAADYDMSLYDNEFWVQVESVRED